MLPHGDQEVVDGLRNLSRTEQDPIFTKSNVLCKLPHRESVSQEIIIIS